MSVTYPISPDELHPVGMAAAMAALQRGFDRFDIDFYIVGAVACDIWLSQVHDEPIRRMTKDLDLAVLLNDSAQYETLQQWLTDKFATHHDLFDESDSTDTGLFLQLVATRVLGRQLRGLLKSEPVSTRLLDLLQAELEAGEQSR